MNKRKSVYTVVFIAIIALLAVVVVFFLRDKDIDQQPGNNEVLQEAASELARNDMNLVFSTPELKEINSAYESQDYDKVNQLAPDICPKSGSSKFSCYGLYAQSLVKKKDFDTLKKLSTEILASEEVKNDVTLQNIWKITLEGADKGIDPAEVKKMTDEEARL